MEVKAQSRTPFLIALKARQNTSLMLALITISIRAHPTCKPKVKSRPKAAADEVAAAGVMPLHAPT
jgi:hypothetical protein